MESPGVIIDKILDYLSDNRWREINDLKNITGLEMDKVSVILDFLEKFDFVSVDFEKSRVKLTESSIKIVAPRIEALEETRAPLRRVP